MKNRLYAIKHKPTNTWVYFKQNMICLCLKIDCTTSSDYEYLENLLLSGSFNGIPNYGADNFLEFDIKAI
jgi:hypothetical protein